MELDEHEEQEEEIEMHPQMEAAVLRLGNSGVKYKECLKNHAVGIGGHALDGCCEFMAAGEEGTLDALKCAACSCHRNFHRKENEGKGLHHNRHIFPPLPSSSHHHHHHPSNSAPHFSAYSYRSHHHQHPSGYLQVTPPPRPLALPSTSRDDEGMSNPSSSGGGGGGGGGGANKKRFRSKFSQEQKDRMLAFAEKVGWRILKQDEAAVQQFCAESNVRRHVLKVWMHNNKHTLGAKRNSVCAEIMLGKGESSEELV